MRLERRDSMEMSWVNGLKISDWAHLSFKGKFPKITSIK